MYLMKINKSIVLRIIAGLVAVALIVGVLFITNSFVGNPISAAIAGKQIKEYVRENYSFLDLEIPKASYNFKNNSYGTRVKSKTNIDIHFYISCKGRNNMYDTYESDVLSGQNTLHRFAQEYAALVTSILERKLDVEVENANIMYYDKGFLEYRGNNPKPGAEFNKDILPESELSLRLNLSDTSSEVLADMFIKVHKLMKDNGFKFEKYSISSENDQKYINVNYVKPEHIESGELATFIEKAKNSSNREDSQTGIYIFIKGEEEERKK